MAEKWTEQQKDAINLRGCSVVVSAAAGSGKTAVLTERLVRLISDENAHVRADRIVAVTFTNDAASELRKRLDRKLRELISEKPSDKWLMKQQTLLQSAHISTIDAFCFDLLRDNITEQGITAGFSVLGDADDNLIKVQSMDELLNYYSTDEPDKLSYMYDIFCLKNDSELEDVIKSTDRFLSSTAMREKWFEKAIEEYKKDPYDTVYFANLIKNSLETLKKLLRNAEICRDMIDDIFYENESKFAKDSIEVADGDIQRISKAIQIFESGRLPDSNEMKYCTSFKNLPRKSEKVDFDVELRTKYQKIRKDFKDKTKSCLNDAGMFDEKSLAECGKVAEILAEMLKKYYEIIWSKKCEKNAICFDDGERLVLELLVDYDENGNIIQSDTAKRLSEFYDIIMVDEYQDSNNKQDLIFKLLSKNFCLNDKNEPIYGNNAFVVGDVKQSIYRFRLANPSNFIHTLKNSEPYVEGSSSPNQLITLNCNFRSSPEVIGFVNMVFSRLMSEECGGVCYDENEQLYFGAECYRSDDRPDSRTHIAFIDTEVPDGEKYNPEAVYTADKIVQMIDSGYETVMSDGSKRPCRASDFCILIRKNDEAKDFVDELRKRGVDAQSQEESGYLRSREIAILLDFLRIIDNPLLDIPLSAVMMSPMYMFDMDELAYIKSLDKDEKLYNILTGISVGNYKACCEGQLYQRCCDFLDALSVFRLDAVTMNVGELIGKIYDMTDFVSVMQLFTDGEKKRANLRTLIQFASSYESSASLEGTGGLTGFIRYIDRIAESNSDVKAGKISSATGDYVSVKTIHKSKGLEYPYIFIARTSSTTRSYKQSAIFSDDGRIGFLLRDKKLMRQYATVPHSQIKKENDFSELSERMRLLYVALTRAKQKLFINMSIKSSQSKKPIDSTAHIADFIDKYYTADGNIREMVLNAESPSEWIWLVLMEHESFSDIVRNTKLSECNIECPEVKYSENLFTTEYVKPVQRDFDTENNVILESLPDEEIYNEISNIINRDYDTVLSETPAKMSVTQITKKFSGTVENFDFKLKRPKFMMENTELTGTERGTAIHTFLQYCDFENAEKNAADELENMIAKGYLSRPQADSVNLDNVAAFFKSSLYERIKNAENVWRERKFMVAVAELDIENELMNSLRHSDGMIKGIVDLIFEEDGKLILVDYKSDRGTSAVTLKKRYTTQLALYKSAMELTTSGTVTEAYLYSFELKKAISVPV